MVSEKSARLSSILTLFTLHSLHCILWVKDSVSQDYSQVTWAFCWTDYKLEISRTSSSDLINFLEQLRKLRKPLYLWGHWRIRKEGMHNGKSGNRSSICALFECFPLSEPPQMHPRRGFPNHLLLDFYGGLITWAWLNNSLAVGKELCL